MKPIRELLRDEPYIKISLFAVFTAVLLCASCLLLLNLKAILAAILRLCAEIASVLSPLWIGLILAYIAAPAVNRISKKTTLLLYKTADCDPLRYPEREKRARALAVFAAFLLLAAAFASVLYSFFILIAGKITFAAPAEIAEEIAAYLHEYQNIFQDALDALPESGLKIQLQEAILSAALWLQNNFRIEALLQQARGLSSNILNLVLGVIVCFYLLIDKTFFLGMWRKTLHLLLPMEYNARLTEALRDINTVVSRFLRGQLLDGLIVAVLSSLGLAFIRLDFAVFIGCFAGICNIIPYFGPIMGMIPAALAGLLAGRPLQAAAAVAVLFVVQQLDSTVISPRVVGNSVGLHPVFVLLAVTLGNACFGIWGMLLAVPAAAILKLFFIRRINML